MKFFVASIFVGLVVAAVAHPPAAIADDVGAAVEEKTDDEKPITESTSTQRSSAIAIEENSDEKLPVKIYYEGLCPDSRKLLSDLGAEYYIFRKYISLDFVPFGRAQSLDADGNEFQCHHGPKECVANRVHSCGVKYLKSQDAKQQFVVCQMRQEADQTGKEVRNFQSIFLFLSLSPTQSQSRLFTVCSVRSFEKKNNCLTKKCVFIFNMIFSVWKKLVAIGQQLANVLTAMKVKNCNLMLKSKQRKFPYQNWRTFQLLSSITYVFFFTL